MPYIKQENRKTIDKALEQIMEVIKDKGDYNYVITKLLHHYIRENGLRYNNLNDAIGIIECVKQEFYRKIVSDYEGYLFLFGFST